MPDLQKKKKQHLLHFLKNRIRIRIQEAKMKNRGKFAKKNYDRLT